MVAETITKPPSFKAVPLADLPDTQEPIREDTAPKRGPGRPRGSGIGKRVGRKPRSMETQIGSTLIMANMPLMMFARGDALDSVEITALARALDAQAQASPRFRKYLSVALEATSGGQLITVVGVIGARRLARHNVFLPPEADNMLASLLGGIADAPPIVVPTEPEAPANGTE